MSNFSCISISSAFNLLARLDIFIMYSLVFPLPSYLIEVKEVKRLFVSSFSFLAKYFLILTRNLLAFSLSIIKPRKGSEMKCLMIIRHMQFDCSHFWILVVFVRSLVEVGLSILNARSKSIHLRSISRLFFQILKFDPFNLGIELGLSDIWVRPTKQKKQTNKWYIHN